MHFVISKMDNRIWTARSAWPTLYHRLPTMLIWEVIQMIEDLQMGSVFT